MTAPPDSICSRKCRPGHLTARSFFTTSPASYWRQSKGTASHFIFDSCDPLLQHSLELPPHTLSPSPSTPLTTQVPSFRLETSPSAGLVSKPPMGSIGSMDGLNECRTARVAEVLSDFRTLQYYIAAAPAEPSNMEEYYTEGWAELRQCSLDGQNILECAADTRVPTALGEEEQVKAELKQVLLDAYARRHEGQKIYLRQEAAQRWISFREQILQGQRPYPAIQPQLQACDENLRTEICAISDDFIYHQLLSIDQVSGRWTVEDPSLRKVLRWLQSRR